MITESKIIGSHFLFFREGDAFTVPAPGVCGINAKPGITPTLDAGWIDVGDVETHEPAVTQADDKLYRPSPGRYVLKDVLENKQELSGKFTTNDVTDFTVESFYRTSQHLGGAQLQFNPLSRISLRGWVHFQAYDQYDNLVLTVDMWCRLRVQMFKMDGTPTKPEFEYFALYSSLSTGAIASD